ncbi:hypothetical protein GEMRC1_010910 [Eukaryota sp. GEM-RC1]
MADCATCDRLRHEIETLKHRVSSLEAENTALKQAKASDLQLRGQISQVTQQFVSALTSLSELSGDRDLTAALKDKSVHSEQYSDPYRGATKDMYSGAHYAPYAPKPEVHGIYDPSIMSGAQMFPSLAVPSYNPTDPRMIHMSDRLPSHSMASQPPPDKSSKFLITPWLKTILNWTNCRKKDHLFSGDKLDFKGFHSKCDMANHVAIVIRNNYGYYFGCYVSHSFSCNGQSECYKPDPDAIIFSLKRGEDSTPVAFHAKPTAQIHCAFDKGIELGDERTKDMVVARDYISFPDLGTNFSVDFSKIPPNMDPVEWMTGSSRPTSFSRFDLYRFGK